MGALQGAPFNFYSGPFGSSMAGSSTDLPLPQPPIPHGDGSDRGEESDSAAMPSWAPSFASCMPGDLDDVEENTDFAIKPEWGTVPQTVAALGSGMTKPAVGDSRLRKVISRAALTGFFRPIGVASGRMKL